MIPWVHLDSAAMPGSATELRLKQRGGEFSIMLGTNELMNSRLSGSEEALARLAIGRLGTARPLEILIGGLGMGFTLRASLAELATDAKVTVAELVPAVVAWARGPMAGIFAGCLDDPRVNIVECDVRLLVGKASARFDAIMLDVDNGPQGLTRRENDALYDAAGLLAARATLKPGGVLAVWSSGPDPKFTARLRRAGFFVEETAMRANGKRGARHTIWIATTQP